MKTERLLKQEYEQVQVKLGSLEPVEGIHS